jgi:hypothetical protein
MEPPKYDAGDKVIVLTAQGRSLPGVVIDYRRDDKGRPLPRAGLHIYRVDIAPQGKPAVGIEVTEPQIRLVEKFEV